MNSAPVVNEEQGSGDGVQNETHEKFEQEAGTEASLQFDLIAEKMRDKGCGEDKLNILRMVLDEMTRDENHNPPNLRNVERTRLKKVASGVNEVLGFTDTCSLSETNRLLITGANVVAMQSGINREGKRREVKPWWKKRIEGKIKQLRQDLSRLERVASGGTTKREIIEKLRKRYNIDMKGRRAVIEELKQRVTGQAAKLKRYEERQKQYRQNRMFETNQKRLFEELEGMEKSSDITPDAQESRELWSEIWGNSVQHNEDAERFKELENELHDVEKQEDVKITIGNVVKQLRKTSNWKSPGPDGLQGFWIKNFSSTKKRIAEQLDFCLQQNTVPSWMASGRTVLIVKDKDLGTAATNFRPIAI